MTPVPQKKSGELMDRVMSYYHGDVRSDFVLRGFLRESKDCIKHDPHSCNTNSLELIIHAMRRDVDATISAYRIGRQRVLGLEDQTLFYKNAAIALFNVGAVAEHWSVVESVWNKALGSSAIATLVASHSLLSGRINKALEALERLKKFQEPVSETITGLKAFQEFLQKNDSSETDLYPFAEALLDAVRTHTDRVSETQTTIVSNIDDPEGASYAEYLFSPPIASENVVDVLTKFSDARAELPDSKIPIGLVTFDIRETIRNRHAQLSA